MKLYIVASKKTYYNMPKRLPEIGSKAYHRSESFEADYNIHILVGFFKPKELNKPLHLAGSLAAFKYVRNILFEQSLNGSTSLGNTLIVVQQALKLKQQYPNHQIYLYEE